MLFLLAIFFTQSLFSQFANPFTPPEYFPSKAVLIEWNFNSNIWPLYSKLINECQEVAEVILVVRDQGEENTMRNLLYADGVPDENITFVHVPCERMWIRDHGPLSVISDEGVVFMDFDDLANSGFDEDLPTNLANIWGLQSYQFPWILCGGNFMVDGHRTLFTTDRLYTNNPSVPSDTINSILKNYMGIERIVTVSAQHSDYWGHIDMQMKLLNDTIMVISSVEQGSGPNYDTLEYNYNRVAELTAPNGKPYLIARLPSADNWKTYANSLIINHKVIIPVYDHPNDEIAMSIYRNLLPNHTVVGINCNSIIHWEGAVHCITMQLFDEDYFFQPTMFEVTFSVDNGDGDGSVSAVANGIAIISGDLVEEGTEVVFTAHPSIDSEVYDWYLNDVSQSLKDLTFLIASIHHDVDVKVEFSKISNDLLQPNEPLKLYPNPFNQFIKVSNTHGIDKIEVFDLMGNKISVKKCEGSNSVILNTGSLLNGAYIITVVTISGERHIKRAVKNSYTFIISTHD